MTSLRMGTLHAEHVLLGARFSSAEGSSEYLHVDSYPAEKTEDAGAYLVDLTGSTYLLASGPDAAAFSAAALAGRRLAVGEVGFEAVLNGAGGLVGAPLCLRTGDEEYVVCDASPQAASVAAWLRFLSSASANSEPTFPELSLDHADTMLVPLVLFGPAAPRVLADYLHNETLPPVGTVRQLRLDAICCLVTQLPATALSPALLLLVPPPSARVLWRSLLSFTEVEPIGHAALGRRLQDALPWEERLGKDAPAAVSYDELSAWGIVRSELDFVGARGLA